MTDTDIDVFVVCAAESIKPGDAKSFSLSRIHDDGESRPFPVVIIRRATDEFVAYVNACPHDRFWLNIGDGTFFTADGAYLECGRHGAKFDIDTGCCVEGPCKDDNLEPIPAVVIDGDVCLSGIKLVEEDGLSPAFADDDETMDIMIHPD